MDLKIYIGVPKQLINLVDLYTLYVKMKFGLDKYCTLTLDMEIELEGFNT